MDFYAMQLTPRKKDKDEESKRREDQLKKIREHVVTKEELLAELKSGDIQGVNITENMKDDEKKEIRNVSPDFLSSKSFSLSGKESATIEVEDVEINSSAVSSQVKSLEIKKDTKLLEAPLIIETRSEKKKNVVTKDIVATTKTRPQGREDLIVKDFVEAILSENEKKLNIAIENLIVYRNENLESDNEEQLNLKLKKEIIGTISNLFAYKSGKSVLKVFQLLDELGLEFKYQDFEKLPNEILGSEDFKNICLKYLLWFAKKYPDVPSQLHERIYCFNKCGVLNYKEIKGFSALQMAITTDLVNFVKQNAENSGDVERKIFEFALAGLVNEKEFKGMAKVKNIVLKAISSLITLKKEKPNEIAKSVEAYEKIGLIEKGEVLKDEKIEKTIERYLIKFIRENRDHPRKVTALIKDYYNAGLIDRAARDRFLK